MKKLFKILYGNREAVEEGLNTLLEEHFVNIEEFKVTNGADGRFKYHILVRLVERL